jgi:hypothetical protein
MWTCPHCDRPFATRRAHVCAAGLPIEYWLSERTDGQRRAAEAVLAVARKIEGLVIEAVSVGIFIKRERSIVELRPRVKWLQLSFITEAELDSERISRTARWGDHYAYFVRLHDETDVDAELRGWLRQALRCQPGSSVRRRQSR